MVESIFFVMFVSFIFGWVTRDVTYQSKRAKLLAKQRKNLKTYRYDNIWFQGEVQAVSLDDACNKFNNIFRESKRPLRCVPECLEVVK